MSRTTMLAGAPIAASVTDSGLTVNTLLPAFATFLRAAGLAPCSDIPPTATGADPPTATFAPPAWRIVPLGQLHLPTGWSQRGWLDGVLDFEVNVAKESSGDGADQDGGKVAEEAGEEDIDLTTRLSLAPFKKPRRPSLGETPQRPRHDEALLSQYLERSFALHDALQSSQVVPPDESTLLEGDAQLETPSIVRQNRETGEEEEQDDEEDIEATFLTSTSLPSGTQTGEVTFTSTFPATAPEPSHQISQFTASTDTSSSLASSTLTHLPSDPSPSDRRVPLPPRPRRPLTAPHLLSLAHIPSAQHVTSIHPQTMTVSLIVGLISLSPLRTVTVRRTGRTVGVFDLLVGDETRAGFGVTFWVDVAQEESQGQGQSCGQHRGARPVQDELRTSLESLRKGDVVLLRNIALSEFQKVVRGNSLGRLRTGGRTRGANATTVTLLWRAGGGRVRGSGGDGGDGPAFDDDELTDAEDEDEEGSTTITMTSATVLKPAISGRTQSNVQDVIRDKTKRVRAWTRAFVPAAGISPAHRKEKRARRDDDDTTLADGRKRRRVYGDESTVSMTGVGGYAQEELPPDDSLMQK